MRYDEKEIKKCPYLDRVESCPDAAHALYRDNRAAMKGAERCQTCRHCPVTEGTSRVASGNDYSIT